MKYSILLFCLLGLFASKTYCQESHLIVFSEDLLTFDAYLNGVKQNEEPSTNVKITGLEGQSYQLKIKFEDESISDINKNLYFEEMGMAHTVKIKMTKKGYKARFFGSVPLDQSPNDYPEVSYTTTERPEIVEEAISMDVDMDVKETSETVISTKTDVKVTGDASLDQNTEVYEENVSMDVNIGGVEMGVNFSVKETSSGSIDLNQSIEVVEEEVEMEVESEWEETELVEAPPCDMDAQSFKEALGSIESKSFSDSKMTVAKQITKAYCLTADQIKGIVEKFDFESDRLDYAKFAYQYCANPANYYLVNDAFEFESSIEELNEHIE